MQDDLSTVANSDTVSIHTGFPNPALDRIGRGSGKLALDLNQLFIHHPSSTYLFRIAGHGWQADGIFDGDIALIDRSLHPRENDIVIAWEAAGFAICRYKAMVHQDQYWGVVSTVIHETRRATV